MAVTSARTRFPVGKAYGCEERTIPAIRAAALVAGLIVYLLPIRTASGASAGEAAPSESSQVASGANGSSPGDAKTLELRLRAVEIELEGVRAANVRLKEDLKQAMFEITNLNAQLRLTEKNAASAVELRKKAAEPARGGNNESVEELQRRLAVLTRTIALLSEEGRRQAGRDAEGKQAQSKP